MASAADLDARSTRSTRFRKDVRNWLEANFPPALKGKENPMATVEGPTDAVGRGGGLEEGDGRQGLGRADLAGGIWRRRAGPGRRRACSARRWPGSAPATRSAAWA